MAELLMILGAGFVFIYISWASILGFNLAKAGGPVVPTANQMKHIKIWFYSGCVLGIFGSGASLLLLL